MNNSMISSMVTLNSLQKRLDLLADNVANVNTVGYKSKDASFEDTLTRVQGQDKRMQLSGRSTPLGFNMGFGVKMSGTALSFTQGALNDTGVPTDLAIQGNALFAVEADGQKAWTRQGDFHIQQDPADDKQSYLATSEGYYVLNSAGDRIQIPTGASLQIDADGAITIVKGQESTPAGSLGLDYIQRPEGLNPIGNNLLVIAPGANVTDVLTALSSMTTAQRGAASVSVKQGALEQSNVDLSKEMTDMMQVQRTYQLAARALTSSEAMMNMANHLRG
jgi:flagellar basal-body rod protein FlgG